MSVDTVEALVDRYVGEDGYPRFSENEMQRRREALLVAAAARGVSQILLVGMDRAGSAVQWLTGWPVTREAYALLDRDHEDSLYVQFFNHVPLARRLAPAANVAWRGPSAALTVLDEIRRRGASRIGVIGPISAGLHEALGEAGIELVPLGDTYVQLRQQKSGEELDWLRIGAALSDAGIAALEQSLRPGLTEWELADIVERAYVPRGGTTHIHYFGVTPMAVPKQANPAQYPSFRRVEVGDVVVVELSAAFWGYPGQVLRSFAVGAEPTPLFEGLHAAADAAFDAIVEILRDGTTPQEVMAAADVIEDAGFTTIDDLVHGFGGGYFPPVLGSRSRDHDPGQATSFSAGMTVVIQPNVVTPDGRAGVQTGELVHVTADGVERLHAAPRGFRIVG